MKHTKCGNNFNDCTLLQQASFDRMDSEEQQNGVFLNQNSIDLRDRSSSIGSASSLQGSAPGLYWAVRQVIGRDFSENTPGVAGLALAVGS